MPVDKMSCCSLCVNVCQGEATNNKYNSLAYHVCYEGMTIETDFGPRKACCFVEDMQLTVFTELEWKTSHYPYVVLNYKGMGYRGLL